VRIGIPDFSLVVLIGASGSGKSSFAAKHFLETEIVSSDRCRALVADDETDQSSSKAAFEVLYTIAEKRLASRRLTVVDATNLRSEDRAKGIAVARAYHALPVAIVLDLDPEISAKRNATRENRNFGAKVVYDHARMLRRSLRGLRREGYRAVYVLSSEQEVSAVEIVREPLYTDRRNDHGPFDIVGDVHGCYDELIDLLGELGFAESEVDGVLAWRHPRGRRVVFLGDLVDRGPGVVEVLRLVMAMARAGTALVVPGNHENKLGRYLDGRQVTVAHGLPETIAQLDAMPDSERDAFRAEVRAFIDGLVSHFWLDGGKLVVAHAGLREAMHGRGSREVREFALYGETTGETDEFGLPVRYDWASEYRGKTVVVYGHTPVPKAEWLNNTICVDTGCVYGGQLTALRYPERELVSISARRVYTEPVRPLATPGGPVASLQQRSDDVLWLDDIAGKRRIVTRYGAPTLIPAENAAAALEIMSRFCVDPRWLIYIPPTMSPCETSKRGGVLEHPDDAFEYYRRGGVKSVVVEEKHMGSRTVVTLARSEEAARERFGVEHGRGVITTRTGRPFFSGAEAHLGASLLERLGAALDASGFWERFSTSWACIDAELMPWSVKAQELIDRQYAPVGEAAIADLGAARLAMREAQGRDVDVADLAARTDERLAQAGGYTRAFRRYVRPVTSVDDLRLAPFHLLATEGAVHSEKTHLWHMEELARICAFDPLLVATAHREVALDDEGAIASAVAWWLELTDAGGEGVVVKPLEFVTRGKRGVVQPALKVRGPEYLRVVYGPEYRMPENLERLRERGLASKRRLALTEFSAGLEGLHRFVERAPLRAVHECAFGVLALESEPVDPRL
jgi:protein phosphatase